MVKLMEVEELNFLKEEFKKVNVQIEKLQYSPTLLINRNSPHYLK
jgi:hypothetical protein